MPYLFAGFLTFLQRKDALDKRDDLCYDRPQGRRPSFMERSLEEEEKDKRRRKNPRERAAITAYEAAGWKITTRGFPCFMAQQPGHRPRFVWVERKNVNPSKAGSPRPRPGAAPSSRSSASIPGSSSRIRSLSVILEGKPVSLQTFAK